MTLALFDLDNTLIAGDSDYLWGEFLVSKSLVDVQIYKNQNQKFYREYEAGNLDVNSYLRFALSALTQFEPELLNKLHSEFMAECIKPIWLPKAEELLTKHREAGDEIAVITSTNRFVVEPIVQALQVDNLICSEPETKDGRYTGNFVGTPCFAEGKVVKIIEWLQGRTTQLEDAYFYSDSHNDLPLMRKVSKPIAVDPDDQLRNEAEQLDWQIISLR